MSHHKFFVSLSSLFRIQRTTTIFLSQSMVQVITHLRNISYIPLQFKYVLVLIYIILRLYPPRLLKSLSTQTIIHHILFLFFTHPTHSIHHAIPWIALSWIYPHLFLYLRLVEQRFRHLYWFCVLYLGFINCIFPRFWFMRNSCEFTFFHLSKFYKNLY